MKGMKGKRLLAILLSVMLTAGSMSGAVTAAETATASDSGVEQFSEDAGSSATEAAAEEDVDTPDNADEEQDEAEQSSVQDAAEVDDNRSVAEEQMGDTSNADTASAEGAAGETDPDEEEPEAFLEEGTDQENNGQTVDEEVRESVNKDAFFSGVFEGDSPEDFYENSVPIIIGSNTVEISVTEGELFRFEPYDDGTYTFYTEGEYDTLANIMGEIDGEMYTLAADDNSGEAVVFAQADAKHIIRRKAYNDQL